VELELRDEKAPGTLAGGSPCSVAPRKHRVVRHDLVVDVSSVAPAEARDQYAAVVLLGDVQCRVMLTSVLVDRAEDLEVVPDHLIGLEIPSGPQLADQAVECPVRVLLVDDRQVPQTIA
jgi:hypothetical protein